MKLNPDCIRAILLEIENSWEITATSDGILKMGNLSIEAIYNALPDYEKRISSILYIILSRQGT